MSDAIRVSEHFWANQKKYPEFGIYPRRTTRKLVWIIDRLPKKFESLCDVACGDGDFSCILSHIVPIKNIYLFDNNSAFLKTAIGRFSRASNGYTNYTVSSCNLNNNTADFPRSDLTLFIGALHYLFDEATVINRLLDRINSPQLILIAPCTLKDNDEFINKYSTELKTQYAALYRTVDSLRNILETRFHIEDCERIYPDSIESKYGTKQYAFNCYRK